MSRARTVSASAPKACRRPTMCWSRFPTPAPESLQKFSTRFSSRFSRPKRWAKARDLVSPRYTASSRRLASSSMSSRRSTRAPHSASSCRGMSQPPRRALIAPPRLKRLARPMGRPSTSPFADRGKSAAATDLTGEGTILLVEDEQGLRALNARGLASRGYTVLEAGNGVEAIDVLEKSEGRVDLVVSDVVMPEMDGPTLLRELRSRNPNLKIIFVSGYAEDAFQKHLPADGQFAFLAKPFTLKQLVNAVKETLAA